MQPNYMSMSGYGGGFQPMNPFPLTQPQPMQNFMPQIPAPVQRSFPMASDATPSALASMSNYGSMTPVDFGLNFDTPGGLGFRGNGATLSTPNLTGGMNGGGGQRSIFDSFLQQRNADGTTSGGYGVAALGALQGIGNLYLGMQQYGVAKQTLANNKAQFERNFDAQRRTTNAALEDRQRARVASNPGAYQSVGDYMNQNEVR